MYTVLVIEIQLQYRKYLAQLVCNALIAAVDLLLGSEQLDVLVVKRLSCIVHKSLASFLGGRQLTCFQMRLTHGILLASVLLHVAISSINSSLQSDIKRLNNA